MNSIKLWKNFVNKIKILGTNLTKVELFNFIISWLLENRKTLEILDKDFFSKHDLETYMELSPEEYPIAYSELDVEEEINVLGNLELKKIGNIGMIIGSKIEELILFRTTVLECPRCDNQLYIVKVENSTPPEFCLDCSICGWGKYYNGKVLNKIVRSIPATTEELVNGGFIAKKLGVARQL